MDKIAEVRALIPDPMGAGQRFTDSELETYLELADDNVFLATALALEALATVIALQIKANVRSDDSSVTLNSSVAELRRRAAQLRQDSLDLVEGFRLVGGETCLF